MKLWQKGAAAHEKVDHFTVGKDREYDLYWPPTIVRPPSPTPICWQRLACSLRKKQPL